MEPAEYLRILSTHGRRVANRVVLAEMTQHKTKRELSDFYACYGDESVLPEHERCKTGFTAKFDPTGWNDHYSSPIQSLWPEPKSLTQTDAVAQQ